MAYQSYCPFSDILENAVVFFVKLKWLPIHLKDRDRCLARSSMNNQSKVKINYLSGRQSVDYRSTVDHLFADVLTDASVDRILYLYLKKRHFQKCCPHTRTRKAKVFKFLQSKDRF